MKYIIFDFDGTIHKSHLLYESAFREVEQELIKIGIKKDPISKETVKNYIGMNPKEMWSHFLPTHDFSEIENHSKRIGELMISHMKEKGELYKNVTLVLKSLIDRGYTLLILSNAKIKYMDEARSVFGLDSYFKAYYVSEEFNFIPKHGILKKIVEEHPGEHFMIGDRSYDIEAGNQNGVTTIGVTYGYGKYEEISTATHIIDDINQVLEIIK